MSGAKTGWRPILVPTPLLARALFERFACFAELWRDISLEPLWVNGVSMQQQGQRLFVTVDALKQVFKAA
jgi:hypothetical protein